MEMEMIVTIEGTNLAEINKYLSDGWRVKQITSFCEPVAMCGSSYNCKKGVFGAYVVLIRRI